MYTKLKEQYQDKLSVLMKDNELFWAFNDEQMKEGIEKHNISKDNKICSIGMGGYLPVKNLEKYIQDTKELEKWYKVEMNKIKENKKEQDKAILYELNNHECFYTGDITTACEVLPNIDRVEVKRVYNEYNA